MPQYFKLRKKVRAGARLRHRPGSWNTRKDDELLRWIRRDGLDFHVLANVYLLSRTAAQTFHGGIIPGIVVSDELLALAEANTARARQGPRVLRRSRGEASRRGARPRLRRRLPRRPHAQERSAMAYVDRATFGAQDWRHCARKISFPRPGELHFFEPDPETGLSSDVVNAAYLESRRRRRT